MKPTLLVGLGNPGPKYETTRHNAGFLVLDMIAEKAGIRWESAQSKFGGDVGRGTVLGRSCILLKPMTYMNRSGRSVGELMRFYKVEAGDMVVLHDDIDVPPGKVKAREGGGAGGHNGIRSIIEDTGLSEFYRIKLGVGKPGPGNPMDVADWVLGPMTDAELLVLQKEMLDETMIRLKGIFDKRG